MEQNINKFGAFIATLALIASVLVMPNVSAGAGDLSITLEGDNGLTAYGPKYGNASFTGSVSSTSEDSDDNLTISVSFGEATWDANNAFIGPWDGGDCEFNDGDTFSASSHDFGTLDGTLDYCITVRIEGNVDNGDGSEMVVNVTSTNSTTDEINAQVIVSDWTSSTTDTTPKTFTESDVVESDCTVAINCHVYTISIHNNKLDETGTPVAFNGAVEISYNSATPGWRIDSPDDNVWNEMEMKATIGYIAPGETYNFQFEVSLSGSYALASSYTGNSVLAFQVSENSIIEFVNFEAIVEDNFGVSAQGTGNHVVDNGCTDQDLKVDWPVVIRNFGNLPDTFSISFNTDDALAATWSVTGTDVSTTDSVLPKAEEGKYEFSLEMTVPSGLPAGTTHGFTMTVTSDGDSTQTQTQEFSATVAQCYGVSMTVDKIADSAKPGETADFTFTVTNEGNGADTVTVVIESFNNASTPTLSESSILIQSGLTGQTVVTMTVPSSAQAVGANPNKYTIMVHAYSQGCGEELSSACAYYGMAPMSTLTTAQVYDISTSYYYNSSTASASVQEGMMKQMKFNVTNNGNGNEEITLALVNAPSWVTIGQDNAPVLLGPGQTKTVTMDVLAPASGSLGANTFQVIATSTDKITTFTTDDFTVTVVEQSTDASGPTTEEVDDDDGGLPGFGFLPAIAAIGAVLLLRRRL